jgi:hypothetical protein
LRQTDWISNAVLNVEIERIELCVWAKENVNAVKAEPRLVHYVRAEGMDFVQREDLAMRSPRITKPGNVVSL